MCQNVEANHIAICTTKIGGNSSEITATNEMGGTVRFIFSNSYTCKGGCYLGEITVYFPTADKNAISNALAESDTEVHVFGNSVRGFLRDASWEVVA